MEGGAGSTGAVKGTCLDWGVGRGVRGAQEQLKGFAYIGVEEEQWWGGGPGGTGEVKGTWMDWRSGIVLVARGSSGGLVRLCLSVSVWACLCVFSDLWILFWGCLPLQKGQKELSAVCAV